MRDPAPAAEILIRPMTQEDVGEVLVIDRATFSVPWTEESFRNYLERPEATFLVAECGGAIAGYGSLLLAADQGDIVNVAVRQEIRRRGLGDALVAALLEVARERAARELFLEVRASNAAAQALYRKHGFVPVGTRKRYYHLPTEDAILMRREEEGEQSI